MRGLIRSFISFIVVFKCKLLNRNFEIGKNSRIEWNVKIKGNAPIQIGDNISIRDGAILIPNNGSINIGNNCSVGAYNILDGTGGLTIGNQVRIGPHVCIYSANHRFRNKNIAIHKQGLDLNPVVIEDNVWIGAQVTILAGVKISSGSVIAAGAVVTKDVEENSIMAGNPAKKISDR